MPLIGVFIILNSGIYVAFMPSEAKNIILLVVLTCTFGLPMAFIPIYYYKKITTSIEMSQAQERIVPLLVTASFYYFSYYLLRRMGVPGIIQSFLLACTIAVCLNLLISTKWKISAHMIGMGGVLGLIISLSFNYSASIMFFLMLAVMISGIVAFARLSLNAHTPTQVYAGLATGFATMLLVMNLS